MPVRELIEVKSEFEAGYEASKTRRDFILLRSDPQCAYLYVLDEQDSSVVQNNTRRFRVVTEKSEHFTAVRFEVDLTIAGILEALRKTFGLVEHLLADKEREQAPSRILKLPRRRKS